MTTTTTPRAQELHAQLGPDTYRRAYEAGMSLSAYLEAQDPSPAYNDGLDAFSRQCKLAGIRTRAMPEYGVAASKLEDFEKTPQAHALVPELIGRMWRKAAYGRDVSTRALYTSTDAAGGTVSNPYADAAAGRVSRQIAPAIPLDSVVAITTPITGDTYRAFYLTDDAAAQRLVRVTQGTEIPRAKLVGGDRTIQLKKYGRVLETTYEQMRRMRIDLVALHIARMAVQAEIDKVAAVIDVLVSGDGNSGTAATSYNLTTLDSAAVAGTLTLKGWLAFKMKFANPYMAQVALAQEATALQMMLLTAGSANIPLVSLQGLSGFGSFRQINPGLADGVALGWTSDAPTLKIVAFDNRFAVERVVEIGASLTEVQRWTTKQTETLTMSEVEGYATFDQNAVKVLDVNA